MVRDRNETIFCGSFEAILMSYECIPQQWQQTANTERYVIRQTLPGELFIMIEILKLERKKATSKHRAESTGIPSFFRI